MTVDSNYFLYDAFHWFTFDFTSIRFVSPVAIEFVLFFDILIYSIKMPIHQLKNFVKFSYLLLFTQLYFTKLTENLKLVKNYKRRNEKQSN